MQRLLQANAAVDVKENDNGRFLRRGFGGENLLEAMGSLREEVDERLNVSSFF